MRLVLAAVLLTTISCFTSPTEPGSGTGSVTLRYGETAMVAGKRVAFTEILDSRCPKEVNCVWAGDASVRLESGGEALVLHTNSTAGVATGRLAGVTITLVDVKPERIAASEVNKADYVVALRVSP